MIALKESLEKVAGITVNDNAKWNWSNAEIKRVGYRVVDMISDYSTTLPGGPVFRPCPPDLIESFADGSVQQAGEGWMALKFHDVDGYTAAIEHDLSLADQLVKRVRQSGDLQLLTEPSLSIVCFRFAPMPLRNDEEELNQLNKRLLEAVQLSGNAFHQALGLTRPPQTGVYRAT